MLQLIALGIAQFVAADQAVGAVAVGGDAVAGEHLAHHALHPFGGVAIWVMSQPKILRATSCARGRAAAAQQFQQHQQLIDVAHAHAFGDVVPQALVGVGEGRGHGGILAGVRRGVGPGQAWIGYPKQGIPPVAAGCRLMGKGTSRLMVA